MSMPVTRVTPVVELDTPALLAAVEAKAKRLHLSMRRVCEQAGVSQNTTTRLRAEGYTPDGNVLLALLMWLGPNRSTAANAAQFARSPDPR